MLSRFLEFVIPQVIHLLEAMGVIIIFIGAITIQELICKIMTAMAKVLVPMKVTQGRR